MTEDAWVTAAASVERMRAEIAAIAKERDELREKLRIAEAVRDDARVASQRYLDEKRGLRAQLEELQAHVAVQPVRMNGSTVNIMDSGKHDCGIAEQCQWVYVDEDPHEGLWNCMYSSGHGGPHRHGLGPSQMEPGIPTRWRLGLSFATEAEIDSWYAYARDRLDPNRAQGEDPCLAHTFVGDVCRDCGLVAPRHVDGVRDESCACSPKYREIAPGVHAAYCPLAGKPT